MSTWSEFVREHGPPAYRTAWRILGHVQDCEDVVQESFLEIYRLFVAGKIEKPRALIHRLVMFRALDALRKRKSMGWVDPAKFLDAAPGPRELAMQREDEQRLRAIIAELPPRQASVFCLMHFEGLTHEEIAEVEEISLNAVALALHKARARLRELMLPSRQEHLQ